VEAQALRAQGWSISAIARHLGRDRKTIRRYLILRFSPGLALLIGMLYRTHGYRVKGRLGRVASPAKK